MSVNATSPRSIPWLETFWQDLQPTPGRLNNTMRMVLSSIILLVLVLVLQMPFANYGLYIIFVVGRESPSVSLRTGVLSALVLASAIAIELGVVVLSDNDPMARVLSVIVVTFLSGMASVCTSLPAVGWMLGFFYCLL